MPLCLGLNPGEGVRVDRTDLWMLRAVIDDGAAAKFVDPQARLITSRQAQLYQVGPGLRRAVTLGRAPDEIILVIDAYVPLVHRHPPRTRMLQPEPRQGGLQ